MQRCHAHREQLPDCRYCTTISEDNAVVTDPSAGPREKVAARLLRIEKTILNGETSDAGLRAACMRTSLHVQGFLQIVALH